MFHRQGRETLVYRITQDHISWSHSSILTPLPRKLLVKAGISGADSDFDIRLTGLLQSG